MQLIAIIAAIVLLMICPVYGPPFYNGLKLRAIVIKNFHFPDICHANLYILGQGRGALYDSPLTLTCALQYTCTKI